MGDTSQEQNPPMNTLHEGRPAFVAAVKHIVDQVARKPETRIWWTGIPPAAWLVPASPPTYIHSFPQRPAAGPRSRLQWTWE
jgi:hypothetical protein